MFISIHVMKYGQLLGVLTDEAGSTRYNHLDV